MESDTKRKDSVKSKYPKFAIMYSSQVNIFGYIPHVPAASQCVGSHHLGSTETPEPKKTTNVGWLTTFFNQNRA